jgi:predicted DNA repair protein MutK
MPKLLAVLTVVGTAAMLWVGGHILVVGAHELGWHGPHDLLHRIEEPVREVPGFGGVLGWLLDTAASAAVGLVVGATLVALHAAWGRARSSGVRASRGSTTA